MSESADLVIDIEGEELATVPAGGETTLGRVADVVIDENQYMHRQVARVYDAGERWWIGNTGSKIVLTLYDRDSGSRATVAPGGSAPLPGNDTVLSFQAGIGNYEINLRSGRALHEAKIAVGLDTVVQDVELTLSQKQLIVALAEQMLREPQAKPVIPPTKDAAKRLGWAITRFNGKLDNVCEKYHKVGVRGVKSTVGNKAKDRKRALVEHCVRMRIVTADDLPILDIRDENDADE